MPHPDEGTLRGWMDGELGAAGRARVRWHLARCAACTAALRRLADEDAEAARALGFAPVPQSREPERTAHPRIIRRAAAVLLFAGATAAVAAPGSPVRAWIRSATAPRAEAPSTPARPSPVPAPPPAAPAPAPVAGIAVRPSAGGARVVIVAPRAGVRVRIIRTEGARLGVWGEGAAGQAEFIPTGGGVQVRRPGAGVLLVEVPRAIDRFTLAVGDRVIARLRGGRLELDHAAAAGAGITFQP